MMTFLMMNLDKVFVFYSSAAQWPNSAADSFHSIRCKRWWRYFKYICGILGVMLMIILISSSYWVNYVGDDYYQYLVVGFNVYKYIYIILYKNTKIIKYIYQSRILMSVKNLPGGKIGPWSQVLGVVGGGEWRKL